MKILCMPFAKEDCDTSTVSGNACKLKSCSADTHSFCSRVCIVNFSKAISEDKTYLDHCPPKLLPLPWRSNHCKPSMQFINL